MKKTRRKSKNIKMRKKHKNKTLKKMIFFKGGEVTWYSYFLPNFLLPEKNKNPNDPTVKNNEPVVENNEPVVKNNEPVVENNEPAIEKEKDIPSSSVETNEIRNPEVTNNKTKKKFSSGKNNPTNNVRDLYKIEKDESRVEKEFFDNPNITTWCFDDPKHEPVGIVHVTSVVGVNVLRGYTTTVKNLVGLKGSIDENMHQLRNEIYIEIENVMEEYNIDKVCNVGVAFTKDSGNLILSAFGTAMRKKVLEQ